MDRGAVETWLVRMLRHARARKVEVDWTFYCALGRPGRLDEEVRELGAHVVYSPVPIRQRRAFVLALRRELARGRYNVLHAHHDLVSAVYFLASAGLRIPKRIVHVHNSDQAVLTPHPVKKPVFKAVFSLVCLGAADRVVGISNHTLDGFVRRPRREGIDVVHYYGIDPAPFEQARIDRAGFLRSLSIDPHSKILLFAARMVPEKNPLFALDVLDDLRRIDPTVVGVFAGSGSLESELRRRAAERGLGAHFRYLGWRHDIVEIMMCSDCFILPHPEEPMEGFGIAVVEAQLAGLPMLLSTGISEDPLLPTARYRRLPLAAGSAAWARAGSELLQASPPSRAEAIAALHQSPMDLDRALDELLALHA